jgi:hypothetical protein
VAASHYIYYLLYICKWEVDSGSKPVRGSKRQVGRKSAADLEALLGGKVH